MKTAPSPDIEHLSLEEKVGQLVMIDFTGPTVPDWLRESFRHRHWGGVILFAKNLASRDQAAALCAELQAASGSSLPLFIGVDQEGGIVDRLPFDPLASSPGAMAFGATDDPVLAGEAARINGRELRSIGFNMNFAPCVDVNNNPLNPVIGVRSYGEDPQRVTRFGLEVARGFREVRLVPCAKHFPGHGDTSLDSHLSLPRVDQDRTRLDAVELMPYRALIADGLEMIMTAHIVYPTLDPSGLPATLSRTILTDFLRGELGFEGLIITDSMAMKAVADHFGTGQAAVLAVQAGADIVLACGTRDAHEETVEALLAAVRSGAIDETQLDASLLRIAAVKARLEPSPAPPSAEDAARITEAARKSITIVRNDGALPLSRGQKVLLVAPSLLPVSQLGEIGTPFPLGEELRKRGIEVEEVRFSLADDADIDAGPVEQAASRAELVLLCLYARGPLSAPQRELAARLLAGERRVAVVSLNSPYVLRDLAGAAASVCTYGYARASMQALADVLSGAVEARGRLPVSLRV